MIGVEGVQKLVKEVQTEAHIISTVSAYNFSFFYITIYSNPIHFTSLGVFIHHSFLNIFTVL